MAFAASNWLEKYWASMTDMKNSSAMNAKLRMLRLNTEPPRVGHWQKRADVPEVRCNHSSLS